MDQQNKTFYVFPRVGRIGSARIPVGRQRQTKLGMIEFELGYEDRAMFGQVRTILRKTKVVTLTHAPDIFRRDDPEASNLILAFHEARQTREEFDEPLMVIIRTADVQKEKAAFREFNDRTFNDGFYGLSVLLEKTYLFLHLNEVFAVAPPIRNEELDFTGAMSIFVGEPRFFAEFSPPLHDPSEGLEAAVRNLKTSSIHSYKEGSVNLTGLIPEGRA